MTVYVVTKDWSNRCPGTIDWLHGMGEYIGVYGSFEDAKDIINKLVHGEDIKDMHRVWKIYVDLSNPALDKDGKAVLYGYLEYGDGSDVGTFKELYYITEATV